MSKETNHESLEAAWEALGRGDWDAVATAYTDDMIFGLPGQNDVLRGKPAFRAALENLGAALPPGFEITDLRYFVDDHEIVNIVEWKSDKIPQGTQSAILWKFNDGGKVTVERWYVDTEQWKAAF